MRLLPCRTCGSTALSSKSPDVPHLMGSISGPLVHYKCARCGRLQSITSMEFNRLPSASTSDLNAAGLALPNPTN
jgi:ribosomal protein L37E